MKLLLLAVFAISSIASIDAQSPAKILDSAEKALGGRNAIRAIHSLSRVGTITRIADGASGKYLFKASAPNLMNIAFDLNGVEVKIGCTGRSVWSDDAENGLRTLTGQLAADVMSEAIYRDNLWLHYKEDRSKITAAGHAMVAGHNTNVLIMTTQKGFAVKMYFDPTTGLLVRDEVPRGTGIVTTDYTDYRNVQGVQMPFKNELTRDGTAYEITLDDVKTNASIAATAFSFPADADAPLPDIPSLLRQLQANEDKVDAMLETYSFVQKTTSRELAKDGALKEKDTETYQLSFYKGRRIRRLIEKNGRPLTAKEQQDADKDATHQVEEIDKKLAEEAKSGKKDDDDLNDRNRRISVAEVLRASRLVNPRREHYRGRVMIVFDFEPNPDFDLNNAKSLLKFFGKTAGVIWIDEKDKQVARLDAVLADSFKIGGGVLVKMQKGASFTIEQERVNDEIWLPSRADINLSLRVFMVKGIDVNEVVRSYDYRKFSTEVKDATVNEVKNP